MSIEIIKGGIWDTIQDGGRFGHAISGINPGGVTDFVAYNLANALCGNDTNTAVLELHFPASEIKFGYSTLISLTGADFSPHVNGKPIGMNRPVLIPAGSQLVFRRRLTGMRTYLAVDGGIDVPLWLGSASTHVKARCGGFHGRKLLQGDVVALGKRRTRATTEDVKAAPWSTSLGATDGGPALLYVEGPESDLIGVDLDDLTFQVKAESDRMALHVNHAIIPCSKYEMFSSAVTYGTMQLLPSGKLLILMADHQTTGGYPRIGNIITADLPKLAQLSTGDVFRLKLVTVDEAEKLLTSVHRELAKTLAAVRLKVRNDYEAN